MTKSAKQATTKIKVGVPAYWQKAKKHLQQNDAVMADLIRHYEDPPLRSKGQIFETLVRSVVGQQISAKAADAVWGRFVAAVGEVVPENILRKRRPTLRKAGLSARKVEYIQGLAKAGDFIQSEPWQQLSDAQVKDKLIGLKGIGPWTVNMVLIFTLLRPDILPLGDIGVIRGIERRYAKGKRLTPGKIKKITESWRPYRTVGTWYIWRSLDPEPVEY